MKTAWSFLINTFLVVTNQSYRLGLRISKVHDSALFSKIADPFILGLYNIYHLIHLAYSDAYAEWISFKKLQLGATQAFLDLLKLLGNAKINAWDAAIAGVYAKGTPKYKALLANGHKPFQTGTQEDRIAAVFALIKGIGTDALLAVLKAEIVLAHKDLVEADTAQKAAITATANASIALETARVLMAEGQFSDLGLMMSQYVKSLLSIAPFFDLKAMRKGQQVLFMRLVKKLTVVNIVKRTMLADEQLLLENNGVTILRFYLGLEKNSISGLVFIEVLPGEQKTVSASDLGDVATQHFLLVYNPDLVNKGDCTVEML